MHAFSLTPLLLFSLLVHARAPPKQALSSSMPNEPKIAATWSYKDCGEETDVVQLESFEIAPDPPVPGENLTVKVRARATQSIEEGASADVVVKLGLIKLLQKQFNVCEEARNANASIQCPIAEGSYEVAHTVALPKEIPSAQFKISVRGFTVDDEDMACLDLTVDFRPGRFL
ncbi:ML domain-containing protein [Mycena maculata]|uniref:Phosphatidylglycerol/phosphatidylinositol transfer protein n=1 Tax=Mycena maculata TaxID=230809 RepID=A0AAD7KI61_9AGAR|nr:ML domain-containing protein [Mycena maculata]